MAKIIELNCAFGLGTFVPADKGWKLISAPGGYTPATGGVPLNAVLTNPVNSTPSNINRVSTFTMDNVSPFNVIPGDYVFEYFDTSGAGCGQQYKLSVNGNLTLGSTIPASLNVCTVNGTAGSLSNVSATVTYGGQWSAALGTISPSGITANITPTALTTGNGTVVITPSVVPANLTRNLVTYNVPFTVSKTSTSGISSCVTLTSGSTITCDVSTSFSINVNPNIQAGPTSTVVSAICYNPAVGLDLHRNSLAFSNPGTGSSAAATSALFGNSATATDFLSNVGTSAYTLTTGTQSSSAIKVEYFYGIIDDVPTNITTAIGAAYISGTGTASIPVSLNGTAGLTNAVNWIPPINTSPVFVKRVVTYTSPTGPCSSISITRFNISQTTSAGAGQTVNVCN